MRARRKLHDQELCPLTLPKCSSALLHILFYDFISTPLSCTVTIFLNFVSRHLLLVFQCRYIHWTLFTSNGVTWFTIGHKEQKRGLSGSTKTLVFLTGYSKTITVSYGVVSIIYLQLLKKIPLRITIKYNTEHSAYENKGKDLNRRRSYDDQIHWFIFSVHQIRILATPEQSEGLWACRFGRDDYWRKDGLVVSIWVCCWTDEYRWADLFRYCFGIIWSE